MGLEGYVEVEAFTQEKRRNDTCRLPFNVHYLALFLPHRVLLILGKRTEFFSKPRDLIKSWCTFNEEWSSVVFGEPSGAD